MATKEINDWEDFEYSDPRQVLPRLFPGARVTSTSRSSGDPLSRKNPNSLHIDNPEAFDVAPIPGVKFEDFIRTLRRNGYEVDQALNETGAGRSAWATGDHWHGGRLRFNPDLIEDWEEAGVDQPPAGPTSVPSTTTAAPVGATEEANPLAEGLSNIVQGLGDTVGVVANPLGDVINWALGYNPDFVAQTDMGETFRNLFGLPETPDNLSSAVQQGAASGLFGSLGAKAVQSLMSPGVLQAAVKEFGATPVLDTISGMTAAAASQTAADMGANPVVQFLAGFAGGTVPFAAGSAVRRGVMDATLQKEINARIKAGQDLEEINAAITAAGSDQTVTPASYMAAREYFEKTPDADDLEVSRIVGQGEVPEVEPFNPNTQAGVTPLPANNNLSRMTPEEAESYIQHYIDTGGPQRARERYEEKVAKDSGYSIDNELNQENLLPSVTDGAQSNVPNFWKGQGAKTLDFDQEAGMVRYKDGEGNTIGEESFEEFSPDLAAQAARRAALDELSDAELTKLADEGDLLAHQVKTLRTIDDGPLTLNDISKDGQQPYDAGPPEVSTGGGEPPVGEDVVSRLTTALRGASRLTNEQKALYSAERRSRLEEVGKARATTSGREGFAAEKAALSGEMPKVEFEGIEDQFTPEEINSLFDMVKNNDNLSWYGQITARSGLNRILTGQLPRPSEIDAMGKVFDPEFIKEALNKRSKMAKAMDAAANAVNLPRSVMSSWDLSGMGRQGVFMIGRKEWFNSFKQQFNALGSEKGYQGVMDSIKALPHYDKMEASGLDFTSGGHDLSAREEAFMSRWAEQVPGVKASERAYNAGLNNLRATSFNNIVDKWERLGVELTPERLNSLAKYINDATGRGNFKGKWAQAGPLLNSLFFSPRLIASRVNLLNPVNYAKMDPYVRKEALRDLMAFGTVATTVLGLASAAGADVETDTNSSDFGKIKVGDTRYDILGGFQQYIRLGSQLVTGKRKTLKGETQELGKDYGTPGAYETSMNFLRSKLAPVVAYAVNAVEGENIVGEPFDPAGDTANLFVPLFLQDLANAYADDGFEGFVKTVPAGLGIGNQTFDINAPRGQEKPPLVERVYDRAKEDLGLTPTQVVSGDVRGDDGVDDWEDISESFSDEGIKDWE